MLNGEDLKTCLRTAGVCLGDALLVHSSLRALGDFDGGAEAVINALLEERRPAIHVDASLAMTVPGIIAHQSALKDGEQLKVPIFS